MITIPPAITINPIVPTIQYKLLLFPPVGGVIASSVLSFTFVQSKLLSNVANLSSLIFVILASFEYDVSSFSGDTKYVTVELIVVFSLL